MAEFIRDLKVQLQVDANFDKAEQAQKESLDRIQKQAQGPLSSVYSVMNGGQMGTNTGAAYSWMQPPTPQAPAPAAPKDATPTGSIPPSSAGFTDKDSARAIIKAIEALGEKYDKQASKWDKRDEETKDAQKDGGPAAPDAPSSSPEGSGDMPSAPTGPRQATGDFGRKSLHGWEVQRAITDPMGYIQGGIMSQALGTAGKLAFGGAGSGLASLGLVGGTALAGGAVLAGLKAGDALNDSTAEAAKKDAGERLKDAIMSNEVGLDFRGILFDEARLRPKSPYDAGTINFDYARTGLNAIGVNTGDWKGGLEQVPQLVSDTTLWAHKVGASPDGVNGLLGQAWASGAVDKSKDGSEGFLKKIQASLEEGHKIGIKGNDTLQGMASLMQHEDAKSGSVSSSAMNQMVDMQAFLGGLDKHAFGGKKAIPLIEALGDNDDKAFMGKMAVNYLGPNGLTAHGKERWKKMEGHEDFDKYKAMSDFDRASLLLDMPSERIEESKLRSQQLTASDVPLLQQRKVLGLDKGVSMHQAYLYELSGGREGSLAPARTLAKAVQSDGKKGALDNDLHGAETILANAGVMKEFAETAAKLERVLNLIETQLRKEELGLAGSKAYNSGAEMIGTAAVSIRDTFGKFNVVVDNLAIRAWNGVLPLLGGSASYPYQKK